MENSISIGKSISFVTMGCAKNEVDSERMSELLANAGYEIESDPEIADVVIVNTCSFIQAATEESIDAILEVAGLQNMISGKGKICVAGCMPARYEDNLAQEFPEVSAFVSCSEEEQIVSHVDSILGIERIPGAAYALLTDEDDSNRIFSYVKISDGCDRFCAYCAIPFIRGRYHSFPFNDIDLEVRKRVAQGAREIVLIAQDTGRWGEDFEEPSTLADLLSQLAEAHPEIWFRVMYVQPEGVTDELIEAVESHDNICSYFDIPFQHCDSDILASMNRRGSRDTFLSLVDRIRRRIPDVALRTTLIAGYPGETDEQFEELCDFVSEACFDYVGVFPYSREEGTKAYALKGQISEDEKLDRAQRLRDLADDVSGIVIQQRIGTTAKVLVCGVEDDGQLFGRAECQAPDVDGVTFVANATIGDIVEVRIEDTMMYEMEGTVLT